MLRFCGVSKGIIASYQLVLKNEYQLTRLTEIMRDYIQKHQNKLGSYDIDVNSVVFSGKFILNECRLQTSYILINKYNIVRYFLCYAIPVLNMMHVDILNLLKC